MNQINPDKLLQLSTGTKLDSPAIKLMLAEVYQSQVQQLTDGRFRLQLPSPQGAVHITLPASASAAVQAMLPATPPSLQGALQQLQLQFQPLANGQLQLTLQSAANSLSIPLSLTQVQQLLAIPAAPGSAAARATIPANLLPSSAAVTLTLPGFSPVPLSTQTRQALSAMLPALSAPTTQLLLKLDTHAQDLQLRLTATAANTGNGTIPGNSVVLQKTEQAAIVQQLVRLFNQQAGAADTTKLPPILQSVLQSALSAAPATMPAQYKVQLQQHAEQWQLQLSTAQLSSKVSVQQDDISRPLQFIAGPNQSSGEKAQLTAPQTSVALQTVQQTAQQAVQQAWRHLLPLLPATATDPLASLAELPQPVQQILQLLRQSQPDGARVQTPVQLTQQLAALLQFQPLQPAATVQNSGGALAAAIQLLLGNLLQRPPALANLPANQRLAQLINQLEPAQASNLLRQLAGHSSTLQQSQLATLDSNNNAQQQLLLQLPLQLAGQSVFSQLQLEQREADGKKGGEKKTQWQLTMKFDLQQLGQLLVVAKLQQQQLQLQFYTEQHRAKQLAEQFLPLLKDRCEAQGLQVEQAECVLGKIPDSLLPRANSLLAVKV